MCAFARKDTQEVTAKQVGNGLYSSFISFFLHEIALRRHQNSLNDIRSLNSICTQAKIRAANTKCRKIGLT